MWLFKLFLMWFFKLSLMCLFKLSQMWLIKLSLTWLFKLSLMWLFKCLWCGSLSCLWCGSWRCPCCGSLSRPWCVLELREVFWPIFLLESVACSLFPLLGHISLCANFWKHPAWQSLSMCSMKVQVPETMFKAMHRVGDVWGGHYALCRARIILSGCQAIYRRKL